jgi:tryptophan halogenase
MNEDEATSILLAHLDGEPTAEPRAIPFVPGKRRKIWNRNCVAVGLAGGFLEPLESTSIHMIQSTLLRLMRLFPHRGFDPAETAQFNSAADFEYERIRDFIILHYKANERDDSEMWKYCRNMDIPDTLAHKIELFSANGRVFRESDELFNDENWVQVMIGQRIMPRGYDPLVDLETPETIATYLGNIETVIRRCVAMMPTHRDYIAQHCATAAV